jgi:hypothetical protein
LSIDLEILGDDHVNQSSPCVLAVGTTTKLEWHRPTITRIDIKRTLFFSGSHTDASTQSPGHLT